MKHVGGRRSGRSEQPGATPRLAWYAVALALAAGTAHEAGTADQSMDWQPALAWVEPWRAWTAVFVHYSESHLLINAAGLLLVAALGAAARAPLRIGLAWLVAWPLTQLGLLAQPGLLHYGGLSGVLHAGAAAVAVHLLWTRPRRQRWLGAAILGGMLLKVLHESPWGPPLRHLPGWDIALAPLAHACGLVAGALCAALAESLCGMRFRQDSANTQHS